MRLRTFGRRLHQKVKGTSDAGGSVGRDHYAGSGSMSSEPFKLELQCMRCGEINELVTTDLSFASGLEASCSSCAAVLPGWRSHVRQAIARANDGWSFG